MLLMATAPHPVAVAGGRILAVGETGDIEPSDPHNDALITDGQLTPVQSAPKPVKVPAPVKETT